MEARLVSELPKEGDWQFEPKWDGFRCLAFRDGEHVELRSKSGKTLTRYFPEIANELVELAARHMVLDGKLLIPAGGSLSFDALQMRLHLAEITGGDSGIGRSVAVHMAREGADTAIVYLEENDDARETQRYVEAEGQKCLVIAGDVAKEEFCKEAVERVLEVFGRLDVLVNNSAEQHEKGEDGPLDIPQAQLQETFQTNIFGYFYMAKAALRYLKEGGAIINTTSVTAYKGNKELLDYSATKGAIVAFTRSLSLALAEKKIRVNAVAPGPIWTPLIPASYDAEKTAQHGANVPMKRAGQPNEVAPSFVFLASDDASYMSGQVLHPNGGTVVNS